jgi:hypothetical protein
MELAVNISADLNQVILKNTYSNWGLHNLDVGLFLQDLFGARAERLDFVLLDVLTFFELFNPLVDVVVGCCCL